MPPKKADGEVRIGQRGEVLRFKSPAEFFSENKNIAGFDNPGKSLYTTIRELVENSLDACESISVLPDIQIEVQELDGAELNKVLGIVSHERLDSALFEGASGAKGKGKKAAAAAASDEAGTSGTPSGEGGEPAAKKGRGKKEEALYYRVVVKDNGCGMKHEMIPNMLGRVLAGSKYGVRQTRGKFGLGAKMALIWSKQSTGMPVEVRSATSPTKPVSACVLDIDIQKNEPRVRVHEQVENTAGMRGSELSLLVGGAWTSYRSYIVRYLRQMAVITPYARFRLSVSTVSDKGTLQLEYARRSEEMPKPPSTIKHHPASVHAELLSALLRESKEKVRARPSPSSHHHPTSSSSPPWPLAAVHIPPLLPFTSTFHSSHLPQVLKSFLSKDFSSIDSAYASRLIAEMRMAPDMPIASLGNLQPRIKTLDMPHHAAPCRTMPHHAAPYRTMPHHAAPCRTMPHHAAPCCTMPDHAGPCRCPSLPSLLSRAP